MPEDVPQLECGVLPASHRYVTKRLQRMQLGACRWRARSTPRTSPSCTCRRPGGSNANPTVHADEDRLRWLRNDPLPQFTIVEHDVGFVVGGSRKADGDELYWRITQFMLPRTRSRPRPCRARSTTATPGCRSTDESCWVYVYGWHPDRPLTGEERAKFDKGGYGQMAELGPGFVPLAQPLERLPHRPRGAEAPLLHRHARHRRAGPDGAGKPGPASPTARAST